MDDFFNSLRRLGNEYADECNADLAMYCGEMARPYDNFVIETCHNRKRRKSLMLMLATRGGDASAAYRVGRAFQEFYKSENDSGASDKPDFNVFIPTLCKSAGTILAIAASKVVMSELAELGPIDVQLRDPTEVGESTSSLTPIQAMNSLSEHSRNLFRQHFGQLRFSPSLTFSTKMAAEIATELTVGLLKPMYEQVDPIKLADVERSLKISSDYAERLSQSHGVSNLKEEAIAKLVGGYPSHGFVIDRKETEELFDVVEFPNDKLLAIAKAAEWFMNWMLRQERRSYFVYLCDEPKEEKNEKHKGIDTAGTGEAI